MTQDATGGVPPWGSPDSSPTPRSAPDRVELQCPVCNGTSFREEEGKVETRWGMSKHVLTMRVCQSCAHVLFFYQGGAGSW
ncbi:hypothetical protein [Pseudactinotalea sp.]|uniref:hypothetical protein n=1 Tax=Pseudactinotalea sp. TaxID=1926260 RepID=UPI003B3A93C4